MQSPTSPHTQALLVEQALYELRVAVTLKNYLFFKAACAKLLNISRKSVSERNTDLSATAHGGICDFLNWFERKGDSSWPLATQDMDELRNLRNLLGNNPGPKKRDAQNAVSLPGGSQGREKRGRAPKIFLDGQGNKLLSGQRLAQWPAPERSKTKWPTTTCSPGGSGKTAPLAPAYYRDVHGRKLSNSDKLFFW